MMLKTTCVLSSLELLIRARKLKFSGNIAPGMTIIQYTMHDLYYQCANPSIIVRLHEQGASIYLPTGGKGGKGTSSGKSMGGSMLIAQ